MLQIDKTRKDMEASSSTARKERPAIEQDPKSSKISQLQDAVGNKGTQALLKKNKQRKVIYIAWTIDDGPTKHTPKMIKQISPFLGNAVTWYIQRDQLRGKTDYLKLKKIQDAGAEIAIHSFHPTKNHAAWFPISGKHGAFSLPYAKKTQKEVMNDLISFYKDLKKFGIKTKFVRLPGGLKSELMHYAKTLGINKNRKKIIEIIIQGGNVNKYGSAAKLIANDFKILKSTLKRLGLKLWGGSFKGKMPKISKLSWEAESSGVYSRTDSITYEISKARARNPRSKYDRAGIFERVVNALAADTSRYSRSLVILAHDTTAADISAVVVDMKKMTQYANEKGIDIEYHTMSSLLKTLR